MARRAHPNGSIISFAHSSGTKEIQVDEKTRYRLNDRSRSSLQRYQEMVIGKKGTVALLHHELIVLLFGSLPGALGLVLRRLFYGPLFGYMGKGVILGKDLSLRCPNLARIGSGVAIDDGCLLDARGAGPQGIVIEEEVIVGRQCAIQAKHGSIRIGKKANIGPQCVMSANSGISLGAYLLIGAHCYIGGGFYHAERTDLPMMQQGAYSKGPVVIEDDVWLGAGCKILDNVKIGKGCIIGAGSVVTRDIPEYSIAVGAPARVIRKR